jgi:hypothetical protein
MCRSVDTSICEYLRGGEYEVERKHWRLRIYDRGKGNVRLSANTGICDDLRGEEYELEHEHLYVRRSERSDI